LIAITYSFGLAIILNVGRDYFAAYFGIKICYEIILLVFGKDAIKCLLIIIVNLGFIVVLTYRKNNQSETKE
jgi:hypothetical protein